MSARIFAARDAVSDAMIEHGPDGHIDGYEKITDACLAAADAVMFSDAAVERAATISGHKPSVIRAVIAALKGDDA